MMDDSSKFTPTPFHSIELKKHKKKSKKLNDNVASSPAEKKKTTTRDDGKSRNNNDEDNSTTITSKQQQQQQPSSLQSSHDEIQNPHETEIMTIIDDDDDDDDEEDNDDDDDIEGLKAETKLLLDELEQAKKGSSNSGKNDGVDIVGSENENTRKNQQMEKLKGNELLEVDHLLRLGFEEQIIREYMVEQNKELRKVLKKRQIDVENTYENIAKMQSTNKESEIAVIEARAVLNSLGMKQQMQQSLQQQAEIELSSIETKFSYKQNTISIEEANKEIFVQATKNIIQEIQNRCSEKDIQVLSRILSSTDLEVNNKKKEPQYNTGDSSSDGDNDDDTGGSSSDDDDDDDDNTDTSSSASSDDSSVSVSSEED